MPGEKKPNGEGQPNPEEKKIKSPKYVEQLFNPQVKPPTKPDVEYWTLAVHRLILLVAFLTLLVAGGGTYYGMKLYQHEQEKNRAENKIISEKEQFVITSPMSGDSLNCKDSIEGFSPYTKKNHYLIVIPSNYPDEWLQNDLMKTSVAGKWKGAVQFGEDNLGQGQLYYVKCIATDFILKPGKLTSTPPDAIISNEIKVYRKFGTCQ